jgi:uncharacterized protein (TIGR02284 family)
VVNHHERNIDMTNDEIVSNLNDLIETCKDGEEGFRTCAKDIQNPALKEFFITRSMDCAKSAHELQQIVIQYDGDPETRSTVAGAMHRRWIDFKTALMGKDEEAVLDECERGEDIALNNYEEALEEEWPLNLRSVIERQYQGLRTNHDQVKHLRDQVAATHH